MIQVTRISPWHALRVMRRSWRCSAGCLPVRRALGRRGQGRRRRTRYRRHGAGAPYPGPDARRGLAHKGAPAAGALGAVETGLARVTGDAGVGFGRHLVVASSALTPRAAFPSGSRAAPLPPPHAVEELHLLGRQNLRHACAQAFLLRGEPLPHLSGDPLERNVPPDSTEDPGGRVPPPPPVRPVPASLAQIAERAAPAVVDR